MLEVKHEFNVLADNYRIINISSSIGEYSIATRMIEKIKGFKYETLDGMSMNDQFNHLLSEFQNTNIRLRIVHPISNKLSNVISTLLHPITDYATLECNRDRDDDNFKIIMITPLNPRSKSRDDIINELNLSQLSGFTLDIITEDKHNKMVATLSFDSLNVYNKMKLTGSIELIQERFICYTIVLPRYYMEYSEYVDTVDHVFR